MLHQLKFLLLIVCIPIFADQWSGSDYASNSSVQLSHAQRLIQSLCLKKNATLLDVGCGDGKITAELAEKVPLGKVIGMDASDSMLAKAARTSQEANLPNLTFSKGFVEDFSLNERFDHIVSIHVMHWIKEQEKALQNLYTHLKTHGHIHLILAPSKEGLPFHRALQKTVCAWNDDFADFENTQQVYDMETYRQLMINAGFHIEAMHYLFHESLHANQDQLKIWVTQWLPHGKHLPASKKESFLNELIQNYLIELGLSPDTSAAIPWGEYVLFVEATKLNN